MSRTFLSTIFAFLLVVAQAAGFQPAEAKVAIDARTPILKTGNVPVYVWGNSRVRPLGMILAIHGLTMHGKVFEATAKHLASQHFLVAAPDLRGYGSWYQQNAHCKTQYAVVEKDLVEVAEALRTAYPGVPLFVAGESLGGTAALRLAAHHPELVDGMILSAPALRYHNHLGAHTMAQVAMLLTNPTRRIDVSNYIEYFSNDERVRAEEQHDPLLRKRMGLGELISSCRYMSNSAACVNEVPVDMPVLIMQGSEDRMVKRTAVSFLEQKLKSKKRTIHWFPQQGHILLETAHVEKETLDVLSQWLRQNCAMRTMPTTAVQCSGSATEKSI